LASGTSAKASRITSERHTHRILLNAAKRYNTGCMLSAAMETLASR